MGHVVIWSKMKVFKRATILNSRTFAFPYSLKFLFPLLDYLRLQKFHTYSDMRNYEKLKFQIYGVLGNNSL